MVRNVTAVTLLLLCCAGLVLAQGQVGTLTGTVTDPGGALVPGAAVVATNTATGVESNTTTTNSGAYTLPYLPAGSYSVRSRRLDFGRPRSKTCRCAWRRRKPPT